MSAKVIYHFLYKTINLVNGKEYIGVHSTSNLNDGYLGSGKRFKSAIKKYGKNNFYKFILEYFDYVEEAYNREQEIVNEEYLRRNDVYNINIGGLMMQHTEETKEKISKTKLGTEFTDLHRIKLSNAARNKVGSLNNFHGKTHTYENKLKISESVRNLPRIKCIYCLRLIHPCQFNRYHGENCKKKGEHIAPL